MNEFESVDRQRWGFCLICSVFRFRVYFSVWWYFSNMFVRCYAFIYLIFCGKSVYIFFYFFWIFGLCWCPAGPRQPGTTRDLVRKNTAFLFDNPMFYMSKSFMLTWSKFILKTYKNPIWFYINRGFLRWRWLFFSRADSYNSRPRALSKSYFSLWKYEESVKF